MSKLKTLSANFTAQVGGGFKKAVRLVLWKANLHSCQSTFSADTFILLGQTLGDNHGIDTSGNVNRHSCST